METSLMPTFSENKSYLSKEKKAEIHAVIDTSEG
jgi:hypothetical protein